MHDNDNPGGRVDPRYRVHFSWPPGAYLVAGGRDYGHRASRWTIYSGTFLRDETLPYWRRTPAARRAWANHAGPYDGWSKCREPVFAGERD